VLGDADALQGKHKVREISGRGGTGAAAEWGTGEHGESAGDSGGRGKSLELSRGKIVMAPSGGSPAVRKPW
jgi:hypothetical protein